VVGCGGEGLRAWTVLACLVLAVGSVACGGGDGGSPAPVDPGPAPVFPVRPPGDSPSRATIVLQSDERFAEDFAIANIEDAALAADGTIGAIVSLASRAGARAVLRRAPGGRFSVVFDETNAPEGVDLRTLLRLRMAPSGEMVFQAGTGLDTDRLFFVDGEVIHTLAGALPGAVGPDFRVLGNVRIGAGGIVAFVGGGHTCETSLTPGGSQRYVCDVALFVARDGEVQRLGEDAVDLDEVVTSNVRVEIDPEGNAYFSVPGRRLEPTLLRFGNGELTSLLRAEEAVPGLGAVLRDPDGADMVGGAVLLSGTLPPLEEGGPRPDLIGVLRSGEFEQVAIEGPEAGGGTIRSLRPIGMDGAANVLYEAQIAESDDPAASVRRSLRLWKPTGEVEIAREGRPSPEGGPTVVSIDSARINEAGDVAFLTALGRITAGTLYIDEIRATLRRTDGRLQSVVSSAESVQLGVLSRLTIAGFDDQANLLLLAERGQSSNRVLLLARPDET
jgi:hypothetical protein